MAGRCGGGKRSGAAAINSADLAGKSSPAHLAFELRSMAAEPVTRAVTNLFLLS